MEIFNSELYLSETKITPDAKGNLTIHGAVWAHCDSSIELDKVGSKGSLQLGVRISGSMKPSEAIFEDRVKFLDSRMSCGSNNTFKVSFKNPFTTGSEWYLFFSFLYEDRFWFYAKGIDPHCFYVNFDGSELVLIKTKPPGVQPEPTVVATSVTVVPGINKDDPRLLVEFSNSMELIANRFGARLAVQFGYQYALGRKADLIGLLDKERALTEHRKTISDICSALLQSDEFRKRNCTFLAHPDRVLSIWAGV
jgi:hypothetical protein